MNENEQEFNPREMIEPRDKNRIRGLLYRKIKKKMARRHAEKQMKKEIYEKARLELEPRYIRMAAKRKLRQKYLRKPQQAVLGWGLPQPGQRSVGQNIFDALLGKPVSQTQPIHWIEKGKQLPQATNVFIVRRKRRRQFDDLW